VTAKEALAARTKAAQAAKAKADAESRADSKPQPATLQESWLSADGDRACEAARQAGNDAVALVDAWLAASNIAAIAALADADGSFGPARKAARRALNVLKARGASVPARGPHVARFANEGPEIYEATFSPPDASGTESIAITCRDPGGRYHLAEVILRAPFGVLQAVSGWASLSQLKEWRGRVVESTGVAPVAVPVEWARHRIATAKKQNAASKHVLPLGLDGCRELIEPAPEAEPAHPLTEVESSITDEQVAAHAPRSFSLHEEPEFRGWLPDKTALDDLLQKLGQRLGPDGVREPAKVDAALRDEIADSTDRFFSPEVRAVVADRMRNAAISVSARKGQPRGIEVLATARAVREAGLITSPPREIGFLVAFFQKGVSYLIQQGGGSLRVPIPAGEFAGATDTEASGEEAGASGEPAEAVEASASADPTE
jgi:hypothetical protein